MNKIQELEKTAFKLPSTNFDKTDRRPSKNKNFNVQL